MGYFGLVALVIFVYMMANGCAVERCDTYKGVMKDSKGRSMVKYTSPINYTSRKHYR